MTASWPARRRRIRAVVSVFAGAALVRLAAIDAVARHASVRSYVIVGGAAMAVLSAASVIDEVRRSRTTPGPGHRHAFAMAAWLVTIPLAVAFAVAPTGSAPRNVGLSVETSNRVYEMAYPRLPDGDPVGMSVSDYVIRMRSDTGGSLIGRQVQLTGYLGATRDGRWDRRETVITCCSARPQTFAVRLVGRLPLGVTPGLWLRVIGGRPARDRSANGPTRVAYLSITSATVIPEPPDQ